MCDLKFRFMNIVVKWLGSIYDFFILENSVLKDMFERGVIFEGWFFGVFILVDCVDVCDRG